MFNSFIWVVDATVPGDRGAVGSGDTTVRVAAGETVGYVKRAHWANTIEV